MKTPKRQTTGMRQCGYCGKYAPVARVECSNCHEFFPPLAEVSTPRFESRGEIRRGILYMLLAGVIQYFAAGYSKMTLPVSIPAIVPQVLTPLLFFGGLGFIAYGALRRAAR